MPRIKMLIKFNKFNLNKNCNLIKNQILIKKVIAKIFEKKKYL